jgi:hypothetical protein
VAVVILVGTVKALIVIVPPNRAAVITGRGPSPTGNRWDTGPSPVAARSGFPSWRRCST